MGINTRTKSPTGKQVAGRHFYVQPLMLDGRRLVPGQIRETISAIAAADVARELSERFPAVVAFDVELDEDGNAVDAPRIIVKHGDVPGLDRPFELSRS